MTSRRGGSEPPYRLRPATVEDTGFLAGVVLAATRAEGRLPEAFDEPEWRSGFTEWTRKQRRRRQAFLLTLVSRRTTRGPWPHARGQHGSPGRAINGPRDLSRRREELQGDVVGIPERQARPVRRLDDTAVGDPK